MDAHLYMETALTAIGTVMQAVSHWPPARTFPAQSSQIMASTLQTHVHGAAFLATPITALPVSTSPPASPAPSARHWAPTTPGVGGAAQARAWRATIQVDLMI